MEGRKRLGRTRAIALPNAKEEDDPKGRAK